MKEERSFLHDIASPVTTLQLNLENAISMLTEKKPGHVEVCEKTLQKCLAQIGKLTVLIQARRQNLIDTETK